MPIVCDTRMNSRLSAEEQDRFQNAKQIQEILLTAKTIAIVGMSTELTKPSNMVGSYLMDEGFTVIPVNPRATEILGQTCYPDLKSIPVKVDVVDVFRPAREVAAIVEEAIEIGAKAIWTQLRISDLEAAGRAQAAGLVAVATAPVAFSKEAIRSSNTAVVGLLIRKMPLGNHPALTATEIRQWESWVREGAKR